MLRATLSFAIAAGASSLVGQCDLVPWPPGFGLCGQLLQAVFAVLAGLTLVVGAVQVLRAQPVLLMVFLGTLPLFLAHLYFWMTDPNESSFFPFMAAPPPLLAVLLAVIRKGRRHGR